MRSSGGTSPTHRPQAELPEKIEMLLMLNKEGKPKILKDGIHAE
jgi:hypothetical protein